jgi:pterin-4a-carbinolamine dehydratase
VTAVLERRPDPRRRGLSAEAIEAHLAGLPGWRLAADRRSISCALSFPAYPLAVVFLNLITGLAELSGYYPDIAVRGARVSLRLVAPRGGGLTADVFGFARTLEDAGALGRARWAPGGRAGEAGA